MLPRWASPVAADARIEARRSLRDEQAEKRRDERER
jgi:hypothetical protein